MRPGADYRSRTFHRHRFDLRIKLMLCSNGRRELVHGRSRDLSFSGMGVTLAGSVEYGAACLLFLKFPKVDLEVQLPAIVTHRRGSHYGLQFQQLSGEQKLLIQKICRALPAA